MKTIKRMVASLVLFAAFIVPMGETVHASEVVNPEPRRIISCDPSPSKWHEMKSRGFGVLYRGEAGKNPTLLFNNGATWQCKYCYHVMVTQGEPAQGRPIGNYGTWSPGYQTSMYGTFLYTNNIYYSSTNKVEGYYFSY